MDATLAAINTSTTDVTCGYFVRH